MSREYYRTHIRAKGSSDVESSDYLDHDQYVYAMRYAAMYQDLRRKYRELSFVSVSSPSLSGGGGKGGLPSSPVERKALELAQLSSEIRTIESTALLAADGDQMIQKALLDGAGNGRPYDSLYPMPPCCKSSYYKYRRRFYRMLSDVIGGGKID